MVRQMKEQIERETEQKIEEIQFQLKMLENNKEYVVALLNKVDKTHPNVGNLIEVNELLDRLIYFLKETLRRQLELDKLKKKPE